MIDPRDEIAVNAYADDAMSAGERSAFEARFSTEPDLKRAADRTCATKSAVRRGVSRLTASDDLRARIAAIGAESKAPAAPKVVPRPRAWAADSLFRFAAIAVIAAGIGAGLGYSVGNRQPQSIASADLVAIHKTALLAAQPVEVASSDRHTVKPWFDSTLALAPQVFDLAPEGFPLLGGRVGTLDGQRLPVSVYKKRAHLISVVALPMPGSRDTGGAVTRASRDGYSVLTWSGTDFRYSAISDVATTDLEDFVQKLRRAMQAG